MKMEYTKQNIHNNKKYIITVTIMWKSNVETGRPEMIVWRMRIACWIPRGTNTHSEYVILFFIFKGNNGYAKAARC